MNRNDRSERERHDEHRHEEAPEKAIRGAIEVALTSKETHGFTLSLEARPDLRW